MRKFPFVMPCHAMKTMQATRIFAIDWNRNDLLLSELLPAACLGERRYFLEMVDCGA